MNTYANLPQLKAAVGIAAAVTDFDTRLLDVLEMASREIDNHCSCHFYSRTEARYFDTGPKSWCMSFDPLLSVSAFGTDSELDNTHDGEAWTEGTHYILQPSNWFPKRSLLVAPNSDYSLAANRLRYVKMTATFGYGDGVSATPYIASGTTGTLTDASDTSLVFASGGEDLVEVGQTLLIESEQVYIAALTTDDSETATVERGVNGTTAAAHTAKAASIYRWPKPIERTALLLAELMFRGTDGVQSERVGDYSFTAVDRQKMLVRLLGAYTI